MAKRKPNYRNLRQGQTIHVVHNDSFSPGKNSSFIREYFLYSQKEPKPKPGSIIEKMSVKMAKYFMERFGNSYVFFKRNKAIRAKQRLDASGMD